MSGEISVADAGRALGCPRRAVYGLVERLAARGTLAPLPPRSGVGEGERAAIISFALEHPALGARRIATALGAGAEAVEVSAGTVGNVLRRAGLGTCAARTAAAGRLNEAATV